MITMVRVDNRLIHGQVVSAWIPHLKVEQILVADDEAATSTLMKAAMVMAVPPALDVAIERPQDVDWQDVARSTRRVLVLVRDVAGAERILAGGLAPGEVNLGNVHFGEGRKPVSPSVFLSEQELEALQRIASRGIEVTARAVPTDAKVSLEELKVRHRSAR